MDAGAHVASKPPTTPGGLSLQGIPDRALSPTRLAKLPPILPHSGGGEHPTAAANIHLQAASSELQDTMKLLLGEVCLCVLNLIDKLSLLSCIGVELLISSIGRGIDMALYMTPPASIITVATRSGVILTFGTIYPGPAIMHVYLGSILGCLSDKLEW